MSRIRNRLSPHWKAALDEAWEAYKSGSVPIGAVIVDPQGLVVSRGRNRQSERAGNHGTVFGSPLAHAELNALLALDYERVEPHECTLYTTVEPCPLCMGAAYMAGIRRILFASHDPRAGSADMLGATPYPSMKPVTCVLSGDAELEDAMIALNVEFFCRNSLRKNSDVIESLRTSFPRATAHGERLFDSRALREAASSGTPMMDAIELLRLR